MKNFFVLFLCFLLIVLALLGIGRYRLKANQKVDMIHKLPDISLVKYDSGKWFTLSKERGVDKTVIIFFSPDCEFCEKEIEGILSIKDEFPNVRWLFITQSIIKDELFGFFVRYPINEMNNAIILLEDYPKYFSLYDVSGPPALFVYDKNGELIEESRGAVSVRTLIKWLE